MPREKRIKAIPIVSGEGFGKAYFTGRASQETSVVSISRQDVGDQIMRFNEIRDLAKEDYKKMARRVDESISSTSSIINIYRHILDDPAFIGQVVDTVSSKLYDLETAIRIVSNDFIQRFNSAGTSYFKERSSDMVEICEKLISYIYMDNGRPKTSAEPVVLVVPRTFVPSDLLSYDIEKIAAVISVSAGKTSHAVILARSYSIPVVSGIKNISELIVPGNQLAIDGNKGIVIIQPSAANVEKYGKKKVVVEEYNKLVKKWNREVYSRDGIKIDVLANVSLASDAEMAFLNGADGIGLVRTEYLLSNRQSFPDENVQKECYRKILMSAGKKKCVMRAMDIGGDKIPDFFNQPYEFNPFMGWRAIRILLERKDLFRTQLRAIISAGEGYNYSIMLPMVTTVKEWREAKSFIKKTAGEMGAEMPSCGVLFEVPLSILEMDTFMKDIDFASIGTNDLLQYLAGADRNNPKVNYLYNPIEPAFLKIIKTAIDISKDHGKEITICGEMAGVPTYTVLLLGLGLRKFSIIPKNIPIIKELISHIDISEAEEAMSHLNALERPANVHNWVKRINKRIAGNVLYELQRIDI